MEDNFSKNRGGGMVPGWFKLITLLVPLNSNLMLPLIWQRVGSVTRRLDTPGLEGKDWGRMLVRSLMGNMNVYMLINSRPPFHQGYWGSSGDMEVGSSSFETIGPTICLHHYISQTETYFGIAIVHTHTHTQFLDLLGCKHHPSFIGSHWIRSLVQMGSHQH